MPESTIVNGADHDDVTPRRRSVGRSSVRRILSVGLLAVGLVAAPLAIANEAGAAPAVSTSSAQSALRTTKILAVRVISGNPSQDTLNRFAGAQWAFFKDGTFVFAPSNARTDLFPLRGTYRTNGNTVTMSAKAQTRIGGTGQASTSLDCTLSRSGTQAVVECLWASGMGNAAVVNNIRFANASLNTIAVRATLG
jgi:hypothetical protein